HRLNPCVLLEHGKTVSLPVAKAEDHDGNYTVELDPVAKKAYVTAYFYRGKGLLDVDRKSKFDHALLAEQTFDLIANGFLRGGSIGYAILQSYPLDADYHLGIPPGQHLIKTLMLEASVVAIPANPLTVGKSLPTCSCGHRLSPRLVEAFDNWNG